MKLVMFLAIDGSQRPGLLIGGEVVDLSIALHESPRSLQDILERGLIEKVASLSVNKISTRFANPTLLAPILSPRNIICIGLNYRDHAIESGMAIPTEPIVFGKFGSTIVGPEQVIVLPKISQEVDYEAELVVVIGKLAHHVPESLAIDHVAGYMIGNDVSARDWQLRKPGGQWILGKSFATFAPIGPALITTDEVLDPHALSIQFRLNGEIMQDSSTSQLIFRIEYLVSYLSTVFPLNPGDLIFTGTPSGVGFARKPAVFLQDGDICEVEIENLGILRNTCQLE
jgi:2-keto-4-pentenoate hydratase/2-oxohepta-3-ene-1,7-dioic acid hydratase in catechol pathway